VEQANIRIIMGFVLCNRAANFTSPPPRHKEFPVLLVVVVVMVVVGIFCGFGDYNYACG
jgi:hypothetical protein